MTHSTTIQANHPGSVVQLTKEDGWVRLALWLSGEFTGGDLVQVAEDATFSVEGTDALALSYRRENWLSGVISGAFYAFRTLKMSRRRVVLEEFSGRLCAADMEIVAKGAALAIARLANRELPLLDAEGWTVQVQTVQDGADSESAPRNTANGNAANAG